MTQCIDRDFHDEYIRIDRNEQGSFKCINKNLCYNARDYFGNISEYVLLVLYFIPLKYRCDSKTRHCLVLDYTAYNDAEDYENNEKSVWSVPYLNFYINPKDVRDDDGSTFSEHPKELDVIWDMYKAVLASGENMILERERDLFYRLGIDQGKGPTEGDTYLEFKKSPAAPMQRRCYCVKEKFVTKVDEVGMLNLLDPQNLFAHRYYPLENIDEFMGKSTDGLTDEVAIFRREESRPGIRKDGGIVWLGHYIPENVANRIILPEKLKKCSSVVDDKWDWWNPYSKRPIVGV